MHRWDEEIEFKGVEDRKKKTIRDPGNSEGCTAVLTSYKYKKAEKVNSCWLEQKCSSGELDSFHHQIQSCAVQSQDEGNDQLSERWWREVRPTVDTQTQTLSTLTCKVDDTLERERPSRSDRRLEAMTGGFGVLEGTGETIKNKIIILKLWYNTIQEEG